MVAPTLNDVNLYLTRPLTTPERAAIVASNVGTAAQGPLQRLREGASRLMQSISPSRQRPQAQEMREIPRPAGLPDPPQQEFLTPPSNGNGGGAPTPVSTARGVQGLTEDDPPPQPRAQRRQVEAGPSTQSVQGLTEDDPPPQPRVQPRPRRQAEASQPSSSSAGPAEPAPQTPPPRRRRASISSAPVEVVQPSAQEAATNPTALAASAAPAVTEVTGPESAPPLTAADTTEDTGRINAWFRMQNPAFYNTKVYDPLADLNQANKLDRYMARNTFIF